MDSVFNFNDDKMGLKEMIRRFLIEVMSEMNFAALLLHEDCSLRKKIKDIGTSVHEDQSNPEASINRIVKNSGYENSAQLRSN